MISSADDAIQHYYALRAAGVPKTLRQVAADLGYSYQYLRQFKRAKEAARGRIGGEAAVKRYYQSRAAGTRKTLKQIAAETGYSYAHLRKTKRAYDAAGKWGSQGTQSSTAPRGFARPRRKAA